MYWMCVYLITKVHVSKCMSCWVTSKWWSNVSTSIQMLAQLVLKNSASIRCKKLNVWHMLFVPCRCLHPCPVMCFPGPARPSARKWASIKLYICNTVHWYSHGQMVNGYIIYKIQYEVYPAPNDEIKNTSTLQVDIVTNERVAKRNTLSMEMVV